MVENEKECACGDFLKGLFVGALGGILAGIFFAPKSGKELRSDIKEKGSEVYERANAKSKEIIAEARRQADELKKEADRYLAEARQKAKDILAKGEK